MLTEGDGGAVCIYTQSTTHVVVDITGVLSRAESFTGIVPLRVVDSAARLDARPRG